MLAQVLPPLAQLLGSVGGHESEDHGKIVVEVAWVCAFLTGGKGECVPPVVDAGLLAALAAHVHRQSAALTAAPNTPELEEANRERSARVIPFVRALGNIAAMEEDRYAGAVMSALEEGGAAAVVPSLLAMLAHGPRPLHRLLQVRKLLPTFAEHFGAARPTISVGVGGYCVGAGEPGLGPAVARGRAGRSGGGGTAGGDAGARCV